VDVDPEASLPFLIGDIFDRRESRLMRRIVDQDVDAAEFPHCGIDDVAAVMRRADVAGGEHGLAAGFLDEPFRVLGIIVLVQIGD
jgi:hypothetical protein